jgi:hypothetical protein
MAYFDTFSGSFEKVRICTSKDGKRVWAEKTGDYPCLTGNERDMLKDTARSIGAKLTDPDGIYRRSVDSEARIARSRVEAGDDSNRSMGISDEYRSRSRREQIAAIKEQEKRELEALDD